MKTIGRICLYGTFLTVATLVLGGMFGYIGGAEPRRARNDRPAELELKLIHLGRKMPSPRRGEWLAEHKEPGQTYQEYVDADPVRKSKKLTTIYLCLIGDFSDKQKEVLELTKEYMAIYFDVPVKVHKNLPLAKIPESARRTHPSWGDKQILSTYVLDDVLKPERSDDALACIAFTSSDLWPGKGWNFVFGQASLRDRTGVWSIYRNGDPAQSQAGYQQCLLRTLKVATHETGHILTMEHCTAYQCNMNGCNSQEEGDRQPLHLCPVCLSKICWNLQVEPVPYLKKLEAFCRKHELREEADWYVKALEALGEKPGKAKR